MSVGQHNDRRSCCPRDVKRERGDRLQEEEGEKSSDDRRL
jgi:hypothetical protein